MARIIIDAGPLVALLNSADQYHNWTRAALSRLEPKFSTCEAVLSETCHRLGMSPKTIGSLCRLIDQGILSLDVIGPSEITAIFDLMEKYLSVPMSFADACLVRLVERNPGSALFTTDRDFTIYRQHRRRVIPLIAPFSS
jgi:predicted nucleic acid-binding protein